MSIPDSKESALTEENIQQSDLASASLTAESLAELRDAALQIVHFDHCYRGEFQDSCKYGDAECPAAPDEEGRLGLWNRESGGVWNPLTDDGDALRLAVKLKLKDEEAMTREGYVYELSVMLMRLDGNHGDPHQLLWCGGTIPEPWGDAWQRYEDQARKLLEVLGENMAWALLNEWTPSDSPAHQTDEPK